MEINRLEKMYEDVFANRNCVPCEMIPGLGPEGKCFSIDPKVGKGWCWVYNCGEHASITLMEQSYYQDCFCEIMQPNFLCIGYYYSVSGEQIHPYRRLASSTFHAHIGEEGQYGFVHHKGIPVRSISITLMPEYYETHLKAKYSGAYENPKDAFICIDGIGDFPELLTVFNQIRSYAGSGMPARLYYESKLDEAVSLVLQKSHELHVKNPPARKVSQEDKEALAAIASYIDTHYMMETPLALLAQIGCMSVAKLKYAFKTVYRLSVSDYMQSLRVGYAEHLLMNTDLGIAQIAAATGYRKPGSLTEVFKKHTGMTPGEYRGALAKSTQP